MPVKVAGDHNVGSGLASSLCCGCGSVVATAIIVGAVMVGLALLLLLLWAIIGAVAGGKSCAGGFLLHRLLLPWRVHVGE